MKIAVCLSGQPRTINYAYKNILDHFSNYDVDYFCQSWDYSTYKLKNPGEHVSWEADVEEDKNLLYENLKLFNPKKIAIQSRCSEPVTIGWGTLLYSTAYANFLKKQYEMENNFRYDYVVKSRYDIVFDPNDKFFIDYRAKPDDPYNIFVSYKGRMTYEYNRQNVMDTFYYGSSTAMDMMTNLYTWTVLKMQRVREDNYEHLGPGVRMSDLAESRNMEILATPLKHEAVYRKDTIPLDPMTQWLEIWEKHMSYYR